MSYDSYRGSAGRGGSDRGSNDDFRGLNNFYRGGYRGRGGRGGRGLYRGGRGSYSGGYNSPYYGNNYRGRGGYYNKQNGYGDDWSRGVSYYEHEEQEGQLSTPVEKEESNGENDGEQQGQDFSYRGRGGGGFGYRGSFRGGYKSRNGSHTGEFYKSGGVVDKSSRHYKDFLHDTKLKEFQNPWINIMGVTDESRQKSLEDNYIEQSKADDTIQELQKKKIRLEMALSSLENHASREELHVQLTTEKLDDLVYI